MLEVGNVTRPVDDMKTTIHDFFSVFFYSERMDEWREWRTRVGTLRVQISSIYREMSVMQTENDSVEPI
jgi:hypothetical protein